MFEWLRGKEEVVTPFPDNGSAFAHACTLRYPLLLDACIPALVMEEGRRGREGEHWYLLQLAGPDGVLEIWGQTLPHAPALPASGDFVAFRIVRIATELPGTASLIGYIESRLTPVLNSKKGWHIAESFRPDDLKPVLHL